MINVTIIPVLGDHMNYAYLLQSENGQNAIIDPGESGPIIEVLQKQNLTLDYIFNTHHHWDHTDGNADLVEKYGAKLVGPAKEDKHISGLDIKLDEGNHFIFGDEKIEILETPGHTAGHICFYFPESRMVFTGDTLFLLGCGRLFEGTPSQMWNSLSKIAALPDDTKIYCGHEYTIGLGKFCLKIEPDNEDLKIRMKQIRALRKQNKPTIPGTIKEEKQTNVFLRAGDAKNFEALRTLKDQS